MADILPIIGALVVLAGAVFMVLAAIGIIRMPDPYNRIQAGTKASTLGVVLALIGLGIYDLDLLPKLIVIALFVLITNPLSSHALARAAHAAGVPLADETVRDELAATRAPEAPEAILEETTS
ncbi:MAG: monovalent cation/H(+) antiporter subunit G [Rhodospirillales bacterium]|jgi:multicomponent Na+:H+ antiporter subunit G|nr:monovalent cation/H(+) antiporter subunit G [Rhodospirillales bacterium]